MSPDRELMTDTGVQAPPQRDLMATKPTGLPPGVSPDQVRAEADSETPTTEEQAVYDKFVTRAVAFIHGEETEGSVIRMLNDESAPVHEVVGKTAARVVQLVQQSAKAAGQDVSSDILYGAGQEVVEDLLDTGVEAGIFPLHKDSKDYQDALDMAFLEAVKAYGEKLLKGPDGQRLSGLAQDEYAAQVAQEADAGTIDPAFVQMMQSQEAEFGKMTPVAAGVREAVEQ